MSEWKQWFDEHKDWALVGDITPEQMYQMFKARLVDELEVNLDAFMNDDGATITGELIDTEPPEQEG